MSIQAIAIDYWVALEAGDRGELDELASMGAERGYSPDELLDMAQEEIA